MAFVSRLFLNSAEFFVRFPYRLQENYDSLRAVVAAVLAGGRGAPAAGPVVSDLF